MSRYDDYEDRPQRWDSDRFAREQEQRRGPPVIERERYEEIDRYTRSPPSRSRRGGDSSPTIDDGFYQRRPSAATRYVEEERLDFARRPSRRFFDEEGEDRDRRDDDRGQMVPFERRERIVEQAVRAQRTGPPPPFRPGLVRRQSSLDTFDRKPMRMRETEVVRLPVRRRRSPPRFVEREREVEEIRVAEPDFYGDDEYREYREVRETRRRESEVDRREEVVDRPFPKRGKTRMPLRLVERRVVIDLGYPFEEDGEVLVILKALGKEHIDEVIQRSREYRQTEVVKESRTTYTVEAPPPPREPVEEKVTETRRVVETREVPASVRDWDEHSARSIKRSPSRSTRRARSVSGTTNRELLIIDDNRSDSDHNEAIGALIVPQRKRKSSRSITAEIRALELEKKALKLERDSERDRDKAQRIREGKSSSGGEIIIEKIERDGNVIKIEKDRRGRINLVVK